MAEDNNKRMIYNVNIWVYLCNGADKSTQRY